MASVYSIRLLAASATTFLVAEVPDGFCWIVRDISAASIPGEATGVFSVTGFESATFYGGAYTSGVAAFFHFEGRVLLNPSDFIQFISSSPMDVHISGYQLALP